MSTRIATDDTLQALAESVEGIRQVVDPNIIKVDADKVTYDANTTVGDRLDTLLASNCVAGLTYTVVSTW